MRKAFFALCSVTFVYLISVVFANSVMDDLSGNIIRLHIVANSNSQIDQDIKLKIRNEVLLADINVDDKASAIKNMRKIEMIANKVLRENGFSYGACVNYGNFYFPEKKYDDTTIPGGDYNALKVVLGSGSGENWWCVLSTPVCLPDGTVKFDNSVLKSKLNEKTYALISSNNKYKFKIFEIVEKLF